GEGAELPAGRFIGRARLGLHHLLLQGIQAAGEFVEVGRVGHGGAVLSLFLVNSQRCLPCATSAPSSTKRRWCSALRSGWLTAARSRAATTGWAVRNGGGATSGWSGGAMLPPLQKAARARHPAGVPGPAVSPAAAAA